MSKFRWSETFISIEGEAKYSGRPTIYVRFWGCNFDCKGFNNPNNVDPSDHAVLGFNPKLIPSIQDIPVSIEVGCDSIYSWHKDFVHMSKTGTEQELASELVALIPNGQDWNRGYSLSITGGEPTLRQRQMILLLNQCKMNNLKHIILETNCSIDLTDQFIQDMNDWTRDRPGRLLTWSNSPKLSVSGESWEEAIRPSVAVRQNQIIKSDQYFKFVCDASERDFDEVEKAMREYWDAGISYNPSNVYIMPVSCTEAQQQAIASEVADMCIQRGWTYCHRIHNTIYKNAIGK